MPVATSAPWRSIEIGSGFEDGINFYDEFVPEVVDRALQKLHTVFEERGNPCYCLRMRLDEKGRGFLHRFGKVLPSTGAAAPPLSPETKIPLQHLVSDLQTWPLLAIREGPPAAAFSHEYSADIRSFLRRISWQVVMRLQNRKEFVGFFKIFGIDGSPLPDFRDLQRAAYEIKIEVEQLLARHHVSQSRISHELKQRLHATREAIGRLSGRIAENTASGMSGERQTALHHVAHMLTSHLGAGWNRAACYWPVEAGTLRCLWAQGGDGSDSWREGIQYPLVDEVREADTLCDRVQQSPFPLDDRYLQAAAGERPIEISDINNPSNSNLLAQLWRAHGDVTAMPGDYQRWELSVIPVADMPEVDWRNSASGPKAAEFGQDDPWVRRIALDRPNDPIFVSQNRRYFALPWFSAGELIGIWVVDMAYWGTLDGPNVPSFVLTAEILDALGPAMEPFRRSF